MSGVQVEPIDDPIMPTEEFEMEKKSKKEKRKRKELCLKLGRGQASPFR